MTQAARDGNAAVRLGRGPEGKGSWSSLPLRTESVVWTADPLLWDGSGTAVLLLAGACRDQRRQALRALVARVRGLDLPALSILHREGRGPLLMQGGVELRRPALSSASRDGLASVAVGPVPLGVDVEVVAAPGDVPWGVLSEPEAQSLRCLPPERRVAEFARIWSLKEAYLKALRVGLSRDPARLRVATGSGGWEVHDLDRTVPLHRAETWWWPSPSGFAAVSLVLLDAAA